MEKNMIKRKKKYAALKTKENIIEIGVTIEVRREITKEQETAVGQKISDKRGD